MLSPDTNRKYFLFDQVILKCALWNACCGYPVFF